MRIIEPEKEAVCTSCGTHMMYTEKDILYSYYVDDWRYNTTCEIHGYVNCPKCHKDQYIGILNPNTNLTEEQFREKYKGHIHGEGSDRFSTDVKYRFDLDFEEQPCEQ